MYVCIHIYIYIHMYIYIYVFVYMLQEEHTFVLPVYVCIYIYMWGLVIHPMMIILAMAMNGMTSPQYWKLTQDLSVAHVRHPPTVLFLLAPI